MTNQNDPKNAPLSYADAGVDIDAGNALVNAIKPMIAATRRPGADGSIGGFGGVFDLKATGYEDPLLVAANDGVGTKLKIAIDTGRHTTIGIDLVAMCVNDLIVQGAEPLFFLDYFASGKLDNGIAEQVISGIAKGCEIAGCALTGGETAEMPGMYAAGDYDLAGFSVGAVERNQLLPSDNLDVGDVIIALGSSGVHSNGYSLVRKVVERAGLSWNDAAPFSPEKTLADCLLEPTRIYVKALLELQRQTSSMKALAHITGGGLPENLPRILPDHLGADIDLGTWQPAPVFGWLKETGQVEDFEMLRTFNCGAGMVIIASQEDADDTIKFLNANGENAWQVGRITARADEPVTFSNTINW